MRLRTLLWALVAGACLAEAQLGFAPAALLGVMAWRHGARDCLTPTALGFGLIACALEATMLLPFARAGWVFVGPLIVLHFVWRLPFVLVMAFAARGARGLWLAAVVFGGLDGLRGEIGWAPITLADAFAHYPGLAAGAALGGRGLVSLAVIAVGLGLADALARPAQWRGRLALSATPALICLASFLFQAHSLGEARTVSVAIVQRSVPKWAYTLGGLDPAIAIEIQRSYVEASRELVGAVDLVVWPETAVPRGAEHFPEMKETPGTAWLVGLPYRAGRGHSESNAVLGFDGAAVQVYQKRALVPLYEDQFEAGEQQTVMTLAGVSVAPLLCWESLFSGLLGHASEADLIAVLSDDGAFEHPALAEAHARRTALRAIERGRPALHAGQVGPSFVTDAVGRIQAELPAYEVGVLRTEVQIPLQSQRTPYDRAPFAFPMGCALVGLVLGARWRWR